MLVRTMSQQDKKQSAKSSKLTKQEVREQINLKKEEEKNKVKKLTPPPPKIN
jgi:hypothetical protein